MERVRLGIIGLGNMGGVHARQHMPQLRRCDLTAICDVVSDRMGGFEGVAKFSDSRDLIRSGQVDAVLIATPHYFHTTIGIDAFDNGLHVLTEKPISVHKADCERLIASHDAAVARGGNQLFAAMFNQRTDPHYQAIHSLIQSGELGELRRINWLITDWFRSAAYYASGGWRATWAGEGGGTLLNQCPHNLDMYQWLFGLPNRVRAICGFGKFHDIEVEDDVTAIYEHPNGAIGVFVATTGESPGTNRLEVVGDRGKVVYEDGKITFKRTTVSVQEFCDTTSDSFPSVPTWNCEIPVNGYGRQHMGILQNFVDAILDGTPLIAPAEDGIRSVELANTMILSGLRGGEPIDLPMDGALYERTLMGLIANSHHEKKVVEQTVTDMSASYR